MVGRKVFSEYESDLDINDLETAAELEVSRWVSTTFYIQDSVKNPILLIISEDNIVFASEIVESNHPSGTEITNIQRVNLDPDEANKRDKEPSIRNNVAKEFGSVDHFLDKIGFSRSNSPNTDTEAITTYSDTNKIKSDTSDSRNNSSDNILKRSEERDIVTTTRKKRDPQFSENVRSAYQETCAVCDASRYTVDGIPEVEAAHIKSHENDGPSIIQNGIALCKLHHWAFDNGWLALREDYTIEVKKKTDRSEYAEFVKLDGNEINLPLNESDYPAKQFINWHRNQHNFE